VKVSKTDAAKRQLETAVRLWFYSGEPVSIHTLTAAAHQVLHDLGKAQGIRSILRELPEKVRPEFQKKLRELLSRYENFFKHAERDPNALLDFNPEATECYLLDAVCTYESITQEVTPILSAFKTWMFMHNPDLLNEPYRQALLQKLNEGGPDLRDIPKEEFFKNYVLYFLGRGAV
jgi:hypothetical protein